MRSPNEGQIHRGYIQSWNFTIERKLPQNIIGTVAYVGTQVSDRCLFNFGGRKLTI